MGYSEGKIRAVSVGFVCGAISSFAIAALAGFWYDSFPMPDTGLFLLFAATSITAVSASAFAGAAWLATRFFPPKRSRAAIALGVAAVGLVAWPSWALYVLGRTNRMVEVAAIAGSTLAVAVALGALAYWVSTLALSRRRFGVPAVTIAALVAWGLHATRVLDYPPPAPLANSNDSSVDAPLAAESTNVMLITIDTLRADHLSVYGYGRDTSPNLRELGDRSIVFENAVSQRTFTAPSLATILTGTYPYTHKTLDNRSHLRASNVTLAELLNAKGFRTVAATGNPGLGRSFKFDQGFEIFEIVDIRGQESVYSLDPQEAQLLSDLAFPLLEDIHADRFFAWFHYMDPHGPYIVPAEYKSLYAVDTLSDAHRGAKVPEHSQMYAPIEDSDPFFRSRKLDFFISQYDAEIKFLDDYLGLLFDRMRELGLWRNTILIITADHGEAFGEHRDAYFSHYDPYYHTVHVPLIIAHPDLPGGVRIERSVSLVDIVPTILELLGLPPNPAAQGQSLAELILEGDEAKSRPYHFSTGTGRRAYCTQSVQTDSHKLIMDFRRKPVVLDALFEMLGLFWVPERFFNPYHYRSETIELYDLANDPFERKNIADQEPEMAAALSEVLWAWLDSTHYEGSHRQILAAEIDPKIDEALRALGYVE